MINKIYIIIITLVAFTFLVIYFHLTSKYKNFNKKIDETFKINKNSLPIIADDSKYIELQTKHWIDMRKQGKVCYGLLEKDKILMAKWMEKFNFQGPKILYYNYYDDFKLKHLEDIALKNKDKHHIVKISHLQSNYGIIIMPPYNTKNSLDYVKEIYNQCFEKFKTCFVCNHDRSDPPSTKEIISRKKSSYYELYELIEPGVMIQEFFYTNKNESSKPAEIKVLVLSGYIINIDTWIIYDSSKFTKVFDLAREISKKLGSVLVRIDFFVKMSDDPFVPYLNEISLSPNGGTRRCYWISDNTMKEYKKKVQNFSVTEMKYLDDLCMSSRMRKLPIEKYLTDGDYLIPYNHPEKFKF